MFGVPLSRMTPDLRRSAKTINFGIIYGISAFGLAERLGIPPEAVAFIKQYFERFPASAPTSRDQARCRETRLRHDAVRARLPLPGHHDPEPVAARRGRAPGDQRAIQGTAADIIRRAMVRMDGALAAAEAHRRMLLQVHDELVFEAPDGRSSDAAGDPQVMARRPLPP
jgi:DNA polymerase-1